MSITQDPTLHLNVSVDAPEIVIPSAPTETSSLFLSQIDQCVAYIVETVYFYPASPGQTSDDVVPRLRKVMGDILVPYHFMAGRLQLNSEGKLEINCNRAGALCAGASCDETLAELGDVTLPNAAFRKFVLQPDTSEKLTDSPLLMMQITKFKCGGFVIGFSMNHAIFDGFGALEFVSNFAALARGEPLRIEPKPDRTLLKARNPPIIKYEHREFLKFSEIPKESAFTTADSAESDNSALTLSQSHIFKIFPFSADMLNRLKEAATRDSSVSKCSSFDAIAAHVWQARTKAAEMEPSAASRALFAVDIRNRVIPPLPKGYTGNAVFPAFASEPAGELQKGSLSFAVSKIQEAADRLTDDYVRSAMDWGSIYAGVPNLPGGVFLSAWWKLPFFLMDFGWGKPIYAGPVVNGLVEFVLLLSNGTREGLNVYIALEPRHMENFDKIIYDF